MKKLYKNQKVSLFEAQKALGLGHYTLYRYADGKRKIENMPMNLIIDLAYFFKVEVNELYQKMLDYQKKNGGIK